jgi:protein-S-isoprenylcysteine O-methyltransferase Ste14
MDRRKQMETEKENSKSISDEMDTPFPLWIMITFPFYAGAALAIFLFPVAGDWRWLEGWAFTITFAVITTICVAIINKENPRVLRNRMKTKKEGLTKATSKSAGSDRFIAPIIALVFFTTLILPGVAHRLGWETLSLPVEMVGLCLTSIGIIIMYAAMLQNSFASKLLDINKGQVLVDTGLYARVRHPLYTGGILMILMIPIALGFLWALIPAALSALTIVTRIKYEEEMLIKGMDGYIEYQERVRFKLIPGIY